MDTIKYRVIDDSITFDPKTQLVTIKNKMWSNVFLVSAIATVLMIVWDRIKDILRQFSGYKDLYNGNVQSGLSKRMGFTRSNIQRGLIIVCLMILTYVSFKWSSSTMPLTQAPVDVQAKIKTFFVR